MNPKGDVLKMIDKINDDNVQKEVNSAIMSDPLLDLRLTLFDFFRYRLNKIKEQENFKKVIQEKISNEMEKGEVNSNQLIQLYKIACSENTIAVDSLFSLFRNQNNNLFEQKKQMDSPDEISESFKNLSPVQLEKMDKLMRFLIAMAEKSEKK